MKQNVVLVGVGGQGTILASRALALAVLNKGYQVRSAESLGMAQRGGSVISHLCFGEAIYSALVPDHGADVLIGFDLLEGARWAGKLRGNGVAIVSSSLIPPVGFADYDGGEARHFLAGLGARVAILDAVGLAREAGTYKAANSVLVGAFSAVPGTGLEAGEILETLLGLVPPKVVEVNRKAFEMGRQAYLAALPVGA